MKYILFVGDTQIVAEVIPAENPDLPGFPIEARYAPDFIAKLIPVDDDVEVEQNWVYDPETNTFAPTSVEALEIPDSSSERYTVEDQEIANAYREGVNECE